MTGILESGTTRRMGRPPLKRNVATVMLSVRLPADVIERIDARVGDMTRGEWVRDAIERRLKAQSPASQRDRAQQSRPRPNSDE